MSTHVQLTKVKRLFLDSAPVIYFVERNPAYIDAVRPLFARIDTGGLTAVTSAVTLSECLVYPYRLGRLDLVHAFSDLILSGSNTEFVVLDRVVAESAAQLRALYNLSLADAFQLAAALYAHCDAFLTNDVVFKRVTDLPVLVLGELMA